MRTPTFVLLLLLTAFASAQDPCNVSLVLDSPTCPDDADGSIAVVAGTPGQYSYSWSHAPNLTGAIATGLVAGDYSVVVTDTSGCVSYLDTLLLPPFVAPLGNIQVVNISCPGETDGSVTFTVNPGPYTWQWMSPMGATGTTLTDLGPGWYGVEVLGGACPSWIYAELGDPYLTVEGPLSYCPSDPPHLTVHAEFGFQPHVYTWSTGDSTAAIDVEPGTMGLVEITATDTVIDCTLTTQVQLTELPHPTVGFHAPDTACLRAGEFAITTATNADSLVWRWGTNGFSNDSIIWAVFDEPYWQPISLQGFDTLGCGSAPVLDSVYVTPRNPADLTVAQIPCTTLIELDLRSPSDSCALFIDDELVLHDCSGGRVIDMRQYRSYDLVFYSTRPDQCDDTLALSVEVRTEPIPFLPNTFTPNGDGHNDTWPGPLDIPEPGYELHLFDRWGATVWSTADIADRWDGTGLPEGVYVFFMRMRDPCEPATEVERHGHVTLVR